MTEIYFSRLRKMKPIQRVMIAIELTEIMKRIAIAGIKNSNAGLKPSSIRNKLRERIGR